MKHKTTPPTEVDQALFEALETGDLEMVGTDAFRLTEQGKEKAESLMLTSTSAIEMIMKLTMAHLNATRDTKRQVQTTFDMVLKQLRFKDGVIQQLLAERESK